MLVGSTVELLKRLTPYHQFRLAVSLEYAGIPFARHLRDEVFCHAVCAAEAMLKHGVRGDERGSIPWQGCARSQHNQDPVGRSTSKDRRGGDCLQVMVKPQEESWWLSLHDSPDGR